MGSEASGARKYNLGLLGSYVGYVVGMRDGVSLVPPHTTVTFTVQIVSLGITMGGVLLVVQGLPMNVMTMKISKLGVVNSFFGGLLQVARS